MCLYGPQTVFFFFFYYYWPSIVQDKNVFYLEAVWLLIFIETHNLLGYSAQSEQLLSVDFNEVVWWHKRVSHVNITPLLYLTGQLCSEMQVTFLNKADLLHYRNSFRLCDTNVIMQTEKIFYQASWLAQHSSHCNLSITLSSQKNCLCCTCSVL